MYIIVTYDGEIIFDGRADDFLEQNEYDEDLEEFLNEIIYSNIGSTHTYYGNQGMKYEFEIVEAEEGLL